MTGPDQHSRTDDGESIFVLAARLARRATDGQLVVAGAVGIAAAALIGLIAPSLWLLALPLLCVGSFGIWGIAERTAAERSARLGPTFAGRGTLTTIRIAAAVIGTVAAALTILALVAKTLGTWIS